MYRKNFNDKWLDLVYWELSSTHTYHYCFTKEHQELLKDYGDYYLNAIRLHYWTSKLGKCYNGSIRNPSDDDIAGYLKITKEQLLEIIDSEDIDKLIEDNERAYLEERISEEVQKV